MPTICRVAILIALSITAGTLMAEDNKPRDKADREPPATADQVDNSDQKSGDAAKPDLQPADEIPKFFIGDHKCFAVLICDEKGDVIGTLGNDDPKAENKARLMIKPNSAIGWAPSGAKLDLGEVNTVRGKKLIRTGMINDRPAVQFALGTGDEFRIHVAEIPTQNGEKVTAVFARYIPQEGNHLIWLFPDPSAPPPAADDAKKDDATKPASDDAPPADQANQK